MPSPAHASKTDTLETAIKKAAAELIAHDPEAAAKIVGELFTRSMAPLMAIAKNPNAEIDEMTVAVGADVKRLAAKPETKMVGVALAMKMIRLNEEDKSGKMDA